jgi:hypothetical protein
MSAPNANQASMVSGHAQYAKGYVEETSKGISKKIIETWDETDIGAVGNVTGSKEWQESGKKDAQEGINEMKVCFWTSRFLQACMFGGILADSGTNRQQIYRKHQSQQRVELAGELKSWLARQPVVRGWRRRVWKGRRRSINMR